MANIFEGKIDATGMRFGVVIARFNEFVTNRLLESAIDAIEKNGGNSNAIDILHVPGSFEIPLTCKRLAQTGKYDAIIALGAVIRGSTAHFDYICDACTAGITTAMLETDVPMTFGILTTDTAEQALDRADKGSDVALAAIEMVNLLKLVNA